MASALLALKGNNLIMGRKSKTVDGMRECNICKITKPLSSL
jgi:hypothetical protein